MDKDLRELITGAFLHDIGKIAQRGAITLSTQSNNIAQLACPQRDSRSTHLHVPFTNEFFEQVKGWLPKSVDLSNIANIATYHHRPRAGNIMDLIVQQADWLSAGQDRSKADDDSFSKGRMKSVFDSVSLSEPSEGSIGRGRQVPLRNLSLDETCFPHESLNDSMLAEDNKRLYSTFAEKVMELADIPANLFFEHMLWIYTQYAWCVPSSLRDYPDVSLLDHCITTAAFSAALYIYHRDIGTLEEPEIKNKKLEKFRLVTGDMSGIQDYIFLNSLTEPKGASKRLRARSFYIGLISRIASDYILDRLGLPCFNRIMDAGGKFTLLVPNTTQCMVILKSVRVEMETWLSDTFLNLLRLNLSFGRPLTGEDFMEGNFQKITIENARQMDIQKKRQGRASLTSESQWLSDRMIRNSQNPKHFIEKEMIFAHKLGEILPKSQCLVMFSGRPCSGLIDDHSAGGFTDLFGGLKLNFRASQPALSEIKELKGLISFVPSSDAGETARMVNGQYTANYVPRIEAGDLTFYKHMSMDSLLKESKEEEGGYETGTVKTFAHIAAHAVEPDSDHRAKGMSLLGVLKADVDRLGMIFSQGFPKGQYSLGRVASLSRQLDLFFRGYLTNMLIQKPAFKNIYTVYAGGDDLLYVGPWTTMFEFALFMQDAFARYTCRNPSITLSAALVLCKPSFPLSQAVQQAEGGLEIAKDSGRNRICVFDEVFEWPDFKQALEDGKFLDAAVKAYQDKSEKSDFKLNPGFVYRLIRYYRMYKDSGRLPNLKWRSQLAYDIARNVESANKGDYHSPQLDHLKQMTGLTVQNNMNKLIVSASYCLYKNRS